MAMRHFAGVHSKAGWTPVSSAARACLGLAALVSAAAAAGAPWHKLSDPALGDVLTRDLAVSPDSRWVVYWQEGSPGPEQLYSVRLDGTALPGQISEPLPLSPVIPRFAISMNGQTVIYRADQDTFDVVELYRVPIGGGATTKLSGPMTPGGDVTSFRFSSSGDRVVYVADQEVDERRELYSVPIRGGAVTKLNGVIGTGAGVFGLEVAASRVVFAMQQQAGGGIGLYSVGIAGGALVDLDAVAGNQFIISPAGDRVAYLDNLSATSDLYSVPIAGGASVKLSGAITSGGNVVNVLFNEAGDRVVYVADQQVNERFEIYSVPTAGGPVVKLNGPLVAGGSVLPGGVAIAGDRVLYLADQEVDERIELYSVPITGGAVVKVNATPVAGGDVLDFQLTPDGNWVVYRADQALNDFPALYRAPAGGPAGQDELLASKAPANGSVWGVAPDGRRVVVLATNPLIDFVVRPWAMPLLDPLDPSGEELVDESFFDPDGDALSFLFAPDGSIVYRADQDTDEKIELYAITDQLFRDGFETQ